MVMEWIRRDHSDQFEQKMRQYLCTDEPITGIEKGAGTDDPPHE